MTTLTVADFADTGQWRLIVEIHTDGMKAMLENTLHDDLEPQILFSTAWDEDPDALLRHIENTVYDNPRMLDDFSARILLFDRRTLFIPTHIAEQHEGEEEEIYTSLYRAEPEDVISETDGDITALSSFAPGLKGFLCRTFPGARVSTNLMAQVAAARKGEGLRMLVTVRPKEADFILLDGSALISASTHSQSCQADVAYHACNIISAYGLDPADVALPPTIEIPFQVL